MPPTVVMRNVRTGEQRPVEAESDEFIELKNAVYDHQGAPKPEWEQTGEHHARRVAADAEDGALREEDAGYDHKPYGDETYDVRDIGPEPNPSAALTPGEVEAGLDPETKQKHLTKQFETDQERARGKNVAAAAKAVADSPIDPAPEAAVSSGRSSSRRSRRSGSAGKSQGSRSTSSPSESGDGSGGEES